MNISRRTLLTSLAALPAAAAVGIGARALSSDDDAAPRVIAAPEPPRSGVWTYRGDAARSGVMPGPGWDGPPATLWAAALGASSVAPPAVVDGAVYAGCGGFRYGAVVALDARTGAERWRAATGGEVQTTPAVADGVVYAGSLDGTLYALDAASGAERWRFETEGLLGGSPLVAGGLVYVSCNDANVYALDAATGEVVWRFDRGLGTSVAPALAGGLIVVGGGDLESDEPALFALDAATGEKRWSKKVGSWVIAAPTVVDGIVYAATSIYLGMNGPAAVLGFDAASGDDAWLLEQEDSIGAPVLVHGDTVYITTELNTLLAIDRTTLAERWRYDEMADGDFAPDAFSPVISGGLLYVPTIYADPNAWSKGIVTLEPVSGRLLWTWAGPDPDANYTSPAILDGVVYTASTDGHLYAVSSSEKASVTPAVTTSVG